MISWTNSKNQFSKKINNLLSKSKELTTSIPAMIIMSNQKYQRISNHLPFKNRQLFRNTRHFKTMKILNLSSLEFSKRKMPTITFPIQNFPLHCNNILNKNKLYSNKVPLLDLIISRNLNINKNHIETNKWTRVFLIV